MTPSSSRETKERHGGVLEGAMLRAIPVFVVVVLSSVTSLHAGEGVLEINQACAVNTGCFPGDTALFPVIIQGAMAPGSYILTSNLVVPDPNTTAVWM